GRPHVHQNAHRLFFFARRRRHTRFSRDWSSDVCSSDLIFHLQLSKMQLFYNPDITETTTEFAFPKEESNHIVKVLRKTVGDTLHITNGLGWLFSAEIIVANTKNCLAKITSAVFQPKRNYNLHLAVAPTKMNDRYEWFLEKATEIGIDTITPIICDHSERKVIKAD